MIRGRIAGSGIGDHGHVDGPVGTSKLWGPLDLARNGTKLYIADCGNKAIRVLDLNTLVLDTLTELEVYPTNLVYTGGTLICTAHIERPGGPIDARIIRINASSGAITSEENIEFWADPVNLVMAAPAGAIILDTPFGTLFKYPLGTYSNGWWIEGSDLPSGTKPIAYNGLRDPDTDACLTDDTSSFPVHHYDGPYAGWAGGITIGPVTLLCHQYTYPSTFGMSRIMSDLKPHWAKPYDAADQCLSLNVPCDQWGTNCGPGVGHRSHDFVSAGVDWPGGFIGFQMCATQDGRAATAINMQAGIGPIQYVDTDFGIENPFPEFGAMAAMGVQQLPDGNFVISTADAVRGNNTGGTLNGIYVLDDSNASIFFPKFVESGDTATVEGLEHFHFETDFTADSDLFVDAANRQWFTVEFVNESHATVDFELIQIQSTGGTARIPIGLQPGTGEPLPVDDYWVDENGDTVVDENGDPILLS